jgi:CRISPR-associated protein Cas2
MSERRRYLVTYDVADDRRRNQVFSCCLQHGDHTQFSVFIAELSGREMVIFQATLDRLVHHLQDQVLIFDLGPARRQYGQIVASIGKPYKPQGRVLIV